MNKSKKWIRIACIVSLAGIVISGIVMILDRFDGSSITIFISYIAIFCCLLAVYGNMKKKDEDNSDSGE